MYRDPVHGDIEYPRGEFQEFIDRVIATPEFQRLRAIRQNGVTNLVFHGAEHTRFAHSMGVAWVAARMFDTIKSNSGTDATEEQREATILAGLLHDVGHGPFSHTIEEVVNGLSQDVSFDHERMTARILSEDGSFLCETIENYRTGLSKEVVRFISKKDRTSDFWYYSLISSQLDADRLDYLLRDAKMAGVWTHQFDLQRLIGSLSLHDGKVVVDSRSRDVVESFLLSLDRMYQVVYYHKTVRAASWALRAVLQCAADLVTKSSNRIPELFGSEEDPLYALLSKGDKIPLSKYIDLDEILVWNHVRRWASTLPADEPLRLLAGNLIQRQLPKTIDLKDIDEFSRQYNLFDKAKSLSKDKNPDISPDYLVSIDDPARTSYRRYKVEDHEGKIQAIQIITNGSPQAVEDDPTSIAGLLSNKKYYKRLIVPEGARNELRESMKRNGF